jgi:hypothetical protein
MSGYCRRHRGALRPPVTCRRKGRRRCGLSRPKTDESYSLDLAVALRPPNLGRGLSIPRSSQLHPQALRPAVTVRRGTSESPRVVRCWPCPGHDIKSRRILVPMGLALATTAIRAG